MVNNNQIHEERLYVPWEARRFQGVRNLADYRRVKARTPAAGAGVVAGTVMKAQADGIRWWQRLTPAERFGIATGAATIAGAVAAVISLVIH